MSARKGNYPNDTTGSENSAAPVTATVAAGSAEWVERQQLEAVLRDYAAALPMERLRIAVLQMKALVEL